MSRKNYARYLVKGVIEESCGKPRVISNVYRDVAILVEKALRGIDMRAPVIFSNVKGAPNMTRLQFIRKLYADREENTMQAFYVDDQTFHMLENVLEVEDKVLHEIFGEAPRRGVGEPHSILDEINARISEWANQVTDISVPDAAKDDSDQIPSAANTACKNTEPAETSEPQHAVDPETRYEVRCPDTANMPLQYGSTAPFPSTSHWNIASRNEFFGMDKNYEDLTAVCDRAADAQTPRLIWDPGSCSYWDSNRSWDPGGEKALSDDMLIRKTTSRYRFQQP